MSTKRKQRRKSAPRPAETASRTVDENRCSFCKKNKYVRAWRGPGGVICLDCVQAGLNEIIARAQVPSVERSGRELPCSLCEYMTPPARRYERGDGVACGDCLTRDAAIVAMHDTEREKAPSKNAAPLVAELVQGHFPGQDIHSFATQVRVFPERMRADIQTALDAFLGDPKIRAQAVGLHAQQQTVEFAILVGRQYRIEAAPIQYTEVDTGDATPRRCVKGALWLVETEGKRYALLLSAAGSHGMCTGLHVEVASPPGDDGLKAAEQVFKRIEQAISEARSYRGKVLSLEHDRSYYGRSSGLKVHRLRRVGRDEVILPEATLAILERNVFAFHARRAQLRELGLPVKKGLLLHGRPGTGKTHTIHYLASRLEGHTTLVITAEQVAFLDEYMALARLLQPSIVVIEDVDLIARDRSMVSPFEQVLLNKLLNEMDGLREDAEIIFILTTNRPDTIEPALTARPGRIDQAIEFPLPDEEGRQKLVRLYARGMKLDDGIVATVARRTEGASAAFIKELMRRTAQAAFERNKGQDVAVADVDSALEEMLFSGGQLNVRLLGGRADGGADRGSMLDDS